MVVNKREKYRSALIIIASGLFVIIICIAGFVLFYPRSETRTLSSDAAVERPEPEIETLFGFDLDKYLNSAEQDKNRDAPQVIARSIVRLMTMRPLNRM